MFVGSMISMMIPVYPYSCPPVMLKEASAKLKMPVLLFPFPLMYVFIKLYVSSEVSSFNYLRSLLVSIRCLTRRHYERCCMSDATKDSWGETPPPSHMMAPAKVFKLVYYLSVIFSSDFFRRSLLLKIYVMESEHSVIDMYKFQSIFFCMWQPLKLMGPSLTDFLMGNLCLIVAIKCSCYFVVPTCSRS